MTNKQLEQLELLEFLFDGIELDPALHGCYVLYNADCNAIRLDLLDQPADGSDSLEDSLQDPHTAQVLNRILDGWAFTYCRYKLLHIVWDHIKETPLDADAGLSMVQEKIQKDLTAFNIMWHFSDWFERFAAWTRQDRQELVEQVKSFMQAIKNIKRHHQKLRNDALRSVWEGRGSTVDLETVKAMIQQAQNPEAPNGPLWIRLALEHGLLTDNRNGTYTIGVKSIKIFRSTLLRYLEQYYLKDGTPETQARRSAFDSFPSDKEAAQKIRKKTGESYGAEVFKKARD